MKENIRKILGFTLSLSLLLPANLMAGCKKKTTASDSTIDGSIDTITEASTTSESADDTTESYISTSEENSVIDETEGGEPTKDYKGYGDIVVQLYSLSVEAPRMVEQFMEDNPDMAAKYHVDYMYRNNDEHGYETALNEALLAGEGTAPDLYVAEPEEYVLPYSQGEYAQYAASYEDLIGDVDVKVKDAQIADYTVALGTNEEKGIVALGYQSTVGAFIYRRSIAKEVFGSDDPAVIEEAIGAGSQSWDKFLEASEKLKEKGYAIVSGINDLYQVSDKASQTPWVVNGKLNIDPQREKYIDLAKNVIDNDYTNDTESWSSAWYADMSDESERQVFGWFGPAWLINYVIAYQCKNKAAFGDYAVCQPNIGFWWGGSYLFCNADVIGTDKQEFCARFIEWVTLDTSKDGFQYGWANESFWFCNAKDAVTSAKVMGISDGSLDFLAGQNPYEVFVKAEEYTTAKGNSIYDYSTADSDISFNARFKELVDEYTHGEITREEVITQLQAYAEENGFEVDP